MKVYVKSQQGDWLMPTHSAKARWMLRAGKAQVIQRTPFAIQLTYAATEHGQPVVIGIDDGGVVVGIAAVANDEVVYQEEIHLRTDIKSKMDTRRSYRQGRRHRKTRYRTPRFDNRSASHKKGRLPPSIRSLHEATPRRGRKQPNREQKRNGKNVVSLKGFNRLDTVRFQGQVGYLSGFNGTSMAFIRGEDGRYIATPGKRYKQVPLSKIQRLHHNQTDVRFLVKQPVTPSWPSSRASLADAR